MSEDEVEKAFFRAVYVGGSLGDIDGHVERWATQHLSPICADEIGPFKQRGRDLYLAFGEAVGADDFHIPIDWRSPLSGNLEPELGHG